MEPRKLAFERNGSVGMIHAGQNYAFANTHRNLKPEAESAEALWRIVV